MKYICISTLMFLSLFFCVDKILATSILHEDFNTPDLNIGQWDILNETNTQLLSGGFLNLSGLDSRRSSFVQNKVPFDHTNGIKYKVRFKFLSLVFGSGIAVNDSPVALRSFSHPGQNDWTIFVWPTAVDTFKVFAVACPMIGPCLPTDNPIFTVSGIDALQWHTLYITYDAGKYILALDDSAEKSLQITSRAPKYIWFGNPMIAGTNVIFSNLQIDYLLIDNFSEDISIFPYFSQKDQLWANKEYDTASQWAGLDKSGIDRWGCALTSSAMILQEYGVKALDGSKVNPDKLNTWLKSQPDGYIGSGFLNWLAITRYAKMSYEAGHADTKLEFSRSYDKSNVSLPSILGIPGHFVVAHDEDLINWKINDPAVESKKTLLKTTEIKSINRFVPSETDLSYMLFVSNQDLGVTMKDPSGSNINMNRTEEYLSDDISGDHGSSTFTSFVPKPVDGLYILEAINHSALARIVDTYIYDKDGNVAKDSLLIPPLTTATFTIQYSSAPNAMSPISLDYASIFSYIKSLRQPKTQANGIFQAIYSKFTDLLTDLSMANDLSKFINKQTPKNIDPNVKAKLQNYVMLIEQN